MEVGKIVGALVAIALAGLLVPLYNALVLKPKRLRAKLRSQGIHGPQPSFLLGNLNQIKSSVHQHHEVSQSQPPDSHNCAALLFPFFEQWRRQYGEIFVFSLGSMQILYVNRVDVVREITTCTSLDLGKPSYQRRDRGPLLGQGILTSNGPVWAYQRKILAPELYMDKVKGMMNIIVESADILVKSWKSRIESSADGLADINIDEYMRSFSGDVISRACFGSNYSRGEEIFLKLRALQELMSKGTLATRIPGMRFLPTKRNREVRALEKEVRNLILKVVKEREGTGYEKDLLQMVLEGAKNSDLSREATDRFIVDNCKNIYLAGYETTAVSASWCLMLLAANPEWQQRARAEVLQVCGSRTPDADMVRGMKLLTMVIHESLRLYPPVAVVSREALKDMKFGDIHVPKGVNLWTLMVTLHTDPDVWGPDAYNFKPDRFANGITGACKLPHLYMPFGVGPRMCLGQNLAIVELKVLLALLLFNFSFALSPTYKHSPTLRLVIEPENGVNLSVSKL
ncbi:hypothetical protein SLA2020_521190 [Shorea laevis]